MNVPYRGPWPQLSDADALLMDVARRIQLSKSKHEAAEQNFLALCQHVDRAGSPLHRKVVRCYPSGSFATGTAIGARLAKEQHDIDVVIELDIVANSEPRTVLGLLFEAIDGEKDSRYHGKVTQNTRCVTVTYADGTKIDLMPIARISGPERAGNLFHYKRESGQSFQKQVNPWGFAEHFKSRIEFDPVFYDLFTGRRLLAEDEVLAKADVQPLPDHAPLEEKSARVVALQLVKRARDITWRHVNRRDMRKPPSVALAAIALGAGPVQPRLVDETIAIAAAIRTSLVDKSGPRGTVHITNPAYPIDVFTDRWPENIQAQNVFDADMRHLIEQLHRLKSEELTLQQKRDLLQGLFGETAATYAMDSHLEARRHEMEGGRMHIGSKGKVMSGIAAPAAVATGVRTTAARSATREGGGCLPE